MTRSAPFSMFALATMAMAALLWMGTSARAEEPAHGHGSHHHGATQGDKHHHDHGDEGGKKAAKAPKVFDSAPEVGTEATCPVMGGQFEVTEKTLRSEYEGKHVVFCCPGCKPKFDKDPEKYL